MTNTNEWQETELKNVACYVNDKINIDQLNVNNYISTENLLPYIGGVVPARGLPTTKPNKFKIQDILFSNIRTYFCKIWLANIVGGASPDVLIIRSRNVSVVTQTYLFYCLAQKRFFDYTVQTSKGTKMPRGDKTAIMNYNINFPTDIEEQEKIASVLKSLDDKIELNNQMNQTLEDMAQAIFNEWFVEFNFPNENGEPYKSSGGEMIESELGKIPKGWKIKDLKSIFKFIKGKKPQKIFDIQENKNQYQYLTIKSYTGNESLFADNEKVVLVDKNDIVMVMDGSSSGNIFYGKKGIVASTIAKIQIYNNINEDFIYYLLKSHAREIKSSLTGSAIPHTDKDFIYKIKVALPLNNFNFNIFSNVRKTIIKNQEENQALIKTRNTLLPKLMRGELKV